ncbi:glycosyl hydrolase family 18 protein [Niabella drilacis]|uniref:chitinase n=1 Tax=Niabella drilacis (strain DSM 25811 / CCM 8410 / CCUG 62505 / LMG 26954 / E90) TaxID=1285928 RepID=A0A1G7BJA4_NIADE|nr:glycoside hydrolase family 18 protein [Niabella drilacis]SDE27198.1 Glycosyl hydrolases family 18 [Niabella drilacis]
MKTVVLSLLFCLLFTASKEQVTDSGKRYPGTSPPREFVIGGYLANYSFDKFHFSSLPYLNRVYYFGIAPSDNGTFSFPPADAVRLSLLRSELSKDQQLYWVIGGWTQSKNIPVMAASRDSRSNYIRSVIAFCKQYRVAGVDLDWEDFPVEVDENAYVLLVKELSEKLRSAGIGFTVALGVPEKKVKLAVKIQDFVDEINLMAYGKFDKAGNQATWELFKKWLAACDAAGIKRNKLIVGVPFYGKRLPDGDDHTPLAVTYADIVGRAQPSPRSNKYQKYSYNGVELIKAKTRFLRQEGYKGIMIWELSQDLPAGSEVSLLRAIYNAAN